MIKIRRCLESAIRLHIQINIDQVFERFYKADVARSKTSTGLGLSIAKELVSRMDGEIEAKIEKKEFIVEMNFPIVTDAK